MAEGKVFLLILFFIKNVELFPLPFSRAVPDSLECNICKVSSGCS